MNKITCITRSMNPKLYNKMLELSDPDWNFIRVVNSSAYDYIDYIFSNDFNSKWVLNLDEDCFLTNYNKIYTLIDFLEKNNYDYCGVQDGGSIPVRIHNPLVSNPFFNLFNVEKINKLEKKYRTTKEYNLEVLKNKFEKHIRFKHSALNYDLYEPFYKQFFWLLEEGLIPYFNNATPFDQEKYFVIAPIGRIIPYYNSPTLILDNNDDELAIHTWHSRYYHYPNIKKAINNCYDYAKSKNKTLSNSKRNFKVVDLSK